MARDMVLAKQILTKLAATAGEFVSFDMSLTGHDHKTVKGHIRLLVDAKFVAELDATDVASNPNLYPLTIRITWDGCNWLATQV